MITPGIHEESTGIFRGTLVEDGHVIWKCSHRHSKPQFNVRWSRGYTPWELSAANCAGVALNQKEPRTGNHGKIEDLALPPTYRDDRKFVEVGGRSYTGEIYLSEDGRRVLRIWKEEDPAISGHLDIDAPAKRLETPSGVMDQTLQDWATAALALRRSVWGVVFKDPNEDLVVEHADANALFDLSKRTLSKVETKTKPAKRMDEEASVVEEEKEPTTKPHIQVAMDSGRRVYEVVDWNNDVVGTYVHRGKAVNRLTKVRGG